MLNCELCGKEMSKPHYSKGDFENVCSDCFKDKFWMIKIKNYKKSPENFAIIDHTMYFIGNENENSVFHGFGGRKFRIRFNNGREITTTNLWHNGDIPEKYQPDLKDNAVFIRE